MRARSSLAEKKMLSAVSHGELGEIWRLMEEVVCFIPKVKFIGLTQN